MKGSLIILLMLVAVGVRAQTASSDFDFRKAEAVLADVMQQDIRDEEALAQSGVIASMVGINQFVQGRYDDAIRSLDFAIEHPQLSNSTTQIMNRVFLTHALCIKGHRRALAVLREVVPLLQDLQANTLRGDFPATYADGVRNVMNNLLLPLTSLVSKTFTDQESLCQCFNLMLYLKQFAFYQLANRGEADFRHTLDMDYRALIAKRLRADEVALEMVPCMDIDRRRVRSTRFVAYLLDCRGRLTFVDLCGKAEVEALYADNDSTWMLYSPDDHRLRSLVWQRVEPYVGASRKVYLAPCGILNRANYVLFDSRVRELTSLSELVRDYPIPSTSSEALLIGDVDYDRALESHSRGDRDWGRLRATKKEIEYAARSLSARFKVTTLAGDAVTEEAVRRACTASPAVLHFATHAICYTDSVARKQYEFFDLPWSFAPLKPELTYTGLVLSGGNRGFRRQGGQSMSNDGILLSEEIAKMRLKGTSLVVLSACDSGNGIFDDIEGTLGLVKAFKLAGARTVIVSLSKVDDDAAAEFMTTFYNRLSTGNDLHAAFVQAQQTMWARYPRQSKLWAAFKLIDCQD